MEGVEYDHINIELTNLLPLVVVIGFIIISIAITYPDMAQRPGLDIIRHFSSSQLLNTNVKSYHSPYPWFHFQWASLQIFYDNSQVFHTTLAYLSIMSVLSFYILAKAYLSDIDKKMPVLSTVLWGLFSGFGWLYFLSLKLTAEEPIDYLKLLGMTRDVSYWDVGYGQGPWIWLWFRPLTLGMTGLFILLYLLRRTDLNLRILLPLISISTLTLGLVHFSELVFFLGILLILSIIFSNDKLRISDGSISALVGLSSIAGFSILYFSIGLDVTISNLEVGLSIVTAALALLVTRLKRKYSNLRLPIFNLDFTHYLMIGLVGIWISTLLHWYANSESFHVSLVSSVLGVPWLLYPTLLGISGLFAILGVSYIIKNYQDRSAVVFIIVLIYAIIFGRMLTYINVNYLFVGYWERRIIPLAYAASAILASSTLVWFFEKSKSAPFFQVSLLSLIVVTGLTSTILTVEYQGLSTQKNKLTDSEVSDIQQLDKLNPESYLLTYSPRSLSVSEFSTFAWRINYFRDHIWSAKSPELVLNALSSTGRPTVIYLTENDVAQILKSDPSDGYLIQNLIKVAPEIYNSPTTNIYSLPTLTPPFESSDIVLILPEEQNPIFYNSYNILSIAGYNYTTASIVDIETLSHAHTIIAPSEDLALKVLKIKDDLGLQIEHLIIMNLDGKYGELSNIKNPTVDILLESNNFGKTLLSSASFTTNATEKIQGINFVPFYVETFECNNSYIVFDDDPIEVWKTFAGAKGNIDIPKLSNSNLKAFGNNSLKIKIDKGTYGQWGISYAFADTMNLDVYDFITFHWYGKGDGTRFVVTPISTNRGNVWYEFTDNWIGWKKVILPIHSLDGLNTINEITVNKVTNQNADWSSINQIDFKLSAANMNIDGIYHLDRLSFEKSINVILKVEIKGELVELGLSSWNGDSYLPISISKVNETVSIQDYYLSNGLSVASLLGNDLGNISLNKITDQYYEAQLFVKIPPSFFNDSTSRIGLAIKPLLKQETISYIDFKENRIELPFEAESAHFESGYDDVTNYNTGTFYAFQVSSDGINIHYLNLYPIISALESGEREMCFLGNITKQTLGDLSSYTFDNEPINAGRVIAFEKAELEGNVSIKFDSLIIKNNEWSNMEAIVDGVVHSMPKNASITTAIFNEAALNTAFAEIIPGEGYYLRINVKNAEITLSGPSTSLITFYEDDSLNVLRGTNITLNIEGGELYLRKPKINVNGAGAFKSLYAYKELQNHIRSLGDDCQVNGAFTFEGIYGDAYSIAKNFNLQGNVEISKNLYAFNEWNSLINSIPYLFLTLTLIIVINLYGRKLDHDIL